MQILFFIVLVDPFEVRPISLIQGVDVWARIVFGPHCASTGKIIEIKADIAGNPVIQGPLSLVILAVVTLLPVFLKEFINDLLF